MGVERRATRGHMGLDADAARRRARRPEWRVGHVHRPRRSMRSVSSLAEAGPDAGKMRRAFAGPAAHADRPGRDPRAITARLRIFDNLAAQARARRRHPAPAILPAVGDARGFTLRTGVLRDRARALRKCRATAPRAFLSHADPGAALAAALASLLVGPAERGGFGPAPTERGDDRRAHAAHESAAGSAPRQRHRPAVEPCRVHSVSLVDQTGRACRADRPVSISSMPVAGRAGIRQMM